MFILNLWGEIRELFLRLDMVAFSFIDNIYELFTAIASESLISETIVKQVLNNIYVLVGIFAFFRIAMLLINSIINPDALNKQGAGLSKIFVNMVIMLVLLVFTPTLFQMSRNLAKEVVEGNYIQKLFININDTENTMEPGKEMQRIAIGAVITPEEGFTNEKGDITCSGDCEKALQCLNTINGVEGATGDECMKDDGVAWGKLADYNGVREKDENGDKVYVYNYKPLVLTIVGWTITYILLSFTFDVAKRMIELAVLEIVSPLFIATIVDPKSMQSGPFKKWLKTLGNSYASLFLRIAAISIMLLCVRLLTYWHPAANIGGFGKLIVLIAFLIFVKQLPKWFSNMLGMDGDGTGLGNLGIGKKIGGAALIGGAATKAGHALAGGARTSVGNAFETHRDNKARRKQAYADANLDKDGKRRIKNAAKNPTDSTFAQWKAGQKAVRDAKRDARKASGTGYGSSIGRNLAGMGIGMVEGMKVGANAENVTAAIKNGKGVVGTHRGQSLGLQGKSVFDRIKGKVSGGYNSLVDAAFGNAASRSDNRDAIEKAKVRENSANKKNLSGNTPLEKIFAGSNGDYIKLNKGNERYQDTIAATALRDAGAEVSFKDGQMKVNAPHDISLGNGVTISAGESSFSLNADANGNYTDANVQRMYDKGKGMITDVGFEYIKSQQSVMESSALSQTSEYNNNIAQLSQALPSLMNQQAAAQQIVDGIKGPITNMLNQCGITTIAGMDGASVNLSNASISALGNAVGTEGVQQALRSRFSSDEINSALNQFRSEFQKGTDAEDNATIFAKEIANTKESIKVYQDARDELKYTVDGVLQSTGKATIEEAKIKVDKNKSDADALIKEFENKKSE